MQCKKCGNNIILGADWESNILVDRCYRCWLAWAIHKTNNLWGIRTLYPEAEKLADEEIKRILEE